MTHLEPICATFPDVSHTQYRGLTSAFPPPSSPSFSPFVFLLCFHAFSIQHKPWGSEENQGVTTFFYGRGITTAEGALRLIGVKSRFHKKSQAFTVPRNILPEEDGV